MTVIEFTKVTKTYHDRPVLNQINFHIKKDVLTGIIGRNGVGKTTLMKIIAGFIEENSGTVNVFGKKPFNDLMVSANSIFIDDAMNFPDYMTVNDILRSCNLFYENWDGELARALLDYFEFRHDMRHRHLSKGKKSMFNAIIGIASHCPLTIFDEPTTGMDAAVRKDFYRALLKDYLAHPRTILLSSHHIEEIEDLLEEVLVIHEGTVSFHGPMTDLQEMFVKLAGSEEKLQRFTAGKEIRGQSATEHFSEWFVKNTFTSDEIEQIKKNGVLVNSVSANEAFITLTGQSKGGIDDVFNRAKTD